MNEDFESEIEDVEPEFFPELGEEFEKTCKLCGDEMDVKETSPICVNCEALEE